MIVRLILVFSVCVLFSCKQEKYIDSSELMDASIFHASVKNLTDVMIHDIFSPPQAGRNYAYPAIAAYEVIRFADPENYKSLVGRVRDLKALPQAPENISFVIAAFEAYNQVAKALIFSEKNFLEFVDATYASEILDSIPNHVSRNSRAYGNSVAKHILDWLAEDNYNQTRSFPKFDVTDEPGRWKPTPPAYMDGIEPHWNKIRPFLLESADQFNQGPPTEFSTKKSSQFYKELKEVYEVVKTAREEEKEIAAFWDCNPFVMNIAGHFMHATKKITPGGHWMGITGIACKKENANALRSLEAYALTAIGISDGFISCWDEKYNSNLVRPETVINEELDEEWIPLLQTPPFPEHTSGHSVISTTAAVILTELFGDKFSYTDDVELEYGLPVRSFNSFMEASAEAAISRLYGGIHYRPAIEDGVVQGKKLGEFVVEKLIRS